MWTIRNVAINWKNFWNYTLADIILNVKVAVIRHHSYDTKCEGCCHQAPPVMASNSNTTVIRHHNYKIQYKHCCHQTPKLQNLIQRLLSSDTTGGMSNCTNKNVSLVSGIRCDILIFPTSACMTKNEWNHVWSASTQTVGTKGNWKK